MIITRDIINKNIKFHEYIVNVKGENELRTFDYSDLNKLIDAYKNLLITNGGKTPKCSAIIGDRVSLSQIAYTFACAELGITITIVDIPTANNSIKGHEWNKNIGIKINKLLPITYLLTEDDRSWARPKIDALKQVVMKFIVAKNVTLDFTPNNLIIAQPDSVFLKCTSSGSTGDNKVINHTHEFMYKLIHRNCFMYDGKMGIITNLNHGSSPATYFLPGLVSNKITDLYNIKIEWDELPIATFPEMDHLMFPYSILFDQFLKNPATFKNCKLYTLSYIKSEWVEHIKSGKIKDIISIFGTSETSGPLFLNHASDENFSETNYKKIDDFYKIKITTNNDLEITMPVYETVTTTGDTFVNNNDTYKYHGRSNYIRINDHEVKFTEYDDFVKRQCNGELVFDVNKNSIYLVIWSNTFIDHKKVVTKIDQFLRDSSNNLHFISKYDHLNTQDFLTGIKIDKTLLREYFRNKSEIYTND